MIAVLGSGLSGLLVAKALEDHKIDFRLFDKEAKIDGPGKPMGFCLLHDRCGMELDDEIIEVVQSGRKEKYKEKLDYGEEISSSWKDDVEKYYLHGYDIYEALNVLFTMNRPEIEKETITPKNIENFKREFDTIISTIPPDNLESSIDLKYREIYIAERRNNERLTPKAIYHGDEGIALRSTLNLWGRSWTEFAEKPNNTEFETIRKPVGYDGDLKSLPAISVGRFGRWNKHVLAHNVYYRIQGMIRYGRIS